MGYRLRTFFLISIALLLAGCNYRESKLGDQTIGPGIQKKLTWFERINMQVLQPHCIDCHNSGNAKGDLDVSSYEKLMATDWWITPGDPDDSRFLEVMVEGEMPPKGDPLDSQLIEMVREWIEKGAKK